MAYMLKNCPYVRSLGKLIQKGFSFFWGSDYEPTLVPPEVPFNVPCEVNRCHAAERVHHCVPSFRETISFTYGMPGASNSSQAKNSPTCRIEFWIEEKELLPNCLRHYCVVWFCFCAGLGLSFPPWLLWLKFVRSLSCSVGYHGLFKRP